MYRNNWVAILIVIVALLAGLALLWRQRDIRRTEAETARLAAEVERLQEENARLAQSSADAGELQRLRAGQSELLRLRSEVAGLRRQLKEVESRQPAASRTAQSNAPEQPTAYYRSYCATNLAVVPWKQTLVTGGWTVESGKRVVFFVEPAPASEAGEPGQVLLQARVVEIPEEVLAGIGLDGLKAEGASTPPQAMLTPDQAREVILKLEKSAGVNVLSAPSVVTLDGRQAQVKVAETRVTPTGETYEAGPSVDFVPRISADRTAVELSVISQLRLPAGK